MKKLQSTESELVGHWVSGDNGLHADETTKRIEWLVSGVLEKIADSPEGGAWETLFRDPEDGRFWERTYPHGELQGGGPPRLTRISRQDACAKYGVA